MDPTENLSARVLLKRILSIETPRTPVVPSDSKTQSTSPIRRSSRLASKDAGAQTPQDILRRSLGLKMRESITRKSLPATKKRTASAVFRKTNTPAPASMPFDDGDTPRHILMNILRTEPLRSPVLHKKAEAKEPQPSSANSSITSKCPSIELSGLDLPDITIGNAASTVKGLSRKRPRRSLNVTAFEKRLKDGDDVDAESDESISIQHSSLSLSSSTLSLKTPFANVQTEKRGLQRRVSNRRKITEEEFGAAVNNGQMGGVSFVKQGLSETTFSEGFTLGFSKLSEPNITTDIVHCNTALYAQPDAMSSYFSIVATQDKPTVMVSQLQREITEAEQNELPKERSVYLFPTEELVVAEPQIEECVSQSEDDVDAAESQKEEGKSTADGQSEEEKGTAETQTSLRDDKAKSEEENRVEAQTEKVGADSQNEEDGAVDSQTEEGGVDSQPEEDATGRSQSEEEELAPDSQTEEGGVDSQPEEDATGRSQSEEEELAPDSQTEEDEEGGVDSQPEEDATARSQSEEEELAPDSQTEEDKEGGVDSQPEEDATGRSQSEEEELAPDSQTEEEEGAVDSPTKELGAVDSQTEEEENDAEYQSDQENPAEGALYDSQAEDENDEEPEEEDGEQASEQLELDMEHISRRARSSWGGVMPVTEAGGDFTGVTETGWSDGKSKAHSTFNVNGSLEMGGCDSGQPHTVTSDLAESSTRGQADASPTEAGADKENSFCLSIEDSGHLSKDSPVEAAAQDPAEQEGEWEDEEEIEEVPSKTPAFVREKKIFSHPDPLASPSVLKNVQASDTSESVPAPKPKQVRKRRSAKKEGGLPKGYLMSVFRHFAKTKVSADVYPVLKEIMDKFFQRLAEDLETYAIHAKRKTVEVKDAELLLRRQGYVNDKVPVEVLIEKYLRMDQRRLLIPIATSGNVVIPKK